MRAFTRFLPLILLIACAFQPPNAFAATGEKMPEKAAEKPDDAASGLKSGDYLSARFAGAAGDRGSAMRYLKQSLADDPGNEKLKGQLMLLLLDGGDVAGAAALALAQELRAAPEHEPIVDLILAVDAARQSRYAEAREALALPLAKGKGSVWMPLAAAWLDVGQGKLKKPLQPAQVLPEGEKAPPFLAYHLALINDAAGFTDVAAKQYALSTANMEKAPFRAVEATADFLRRRGATDKLAQLKKDYMAAHPAMSALEGGDTVSQMTVLMLQDAKGPAPSRRLVDTPQEGMAEVFFTMASVLFALDAAQDTGYYLRLALALRPDFPLAQLLLGNALEGEGRFAEAADIYGGISPQSPLFHRALMRKAYVIEHQGKPDEALAMLDARIAKEPGDYEAYVVKADLLRARQRCPDAIAAYNQALGLVPQPGMAQWGIFFARGACYERSGQWAKAEADLRQALTLMPDQPEVLNYLGYGLLQQPARVAEGRALIEQAYGLQPAAPHIIDSMGWALYLSGEAEAAIPYLEQAIELTPSDATVNDHLGDAYWQAGRKTEARYQWQRALTYSPEAKEESALRKKLRDGLPPVAQAANG